MLFILMNFGNNPDAREKVWDLARLIAKLDLKRQDQRIECRISASSWQGYF